MIGCFFLLIICDIINCNIVLSFYSLKRNSDDRDKNQNKQRISILCQISSKLIKLVGASFGFAQNSKVHLFVTMCAQCCILLFDKYRDSPVSVVSISAIPGLVRFIGSTNQSYSPIQSFFSIIFSLCSKILKIVRPAQILQVKVKTCDRQLNKHVK